MPKITKIEKEFFNKLAEILEKEFPKNQCQERGHALVLNSYANLYFRELNKKAIQEVIGEMEEIIKEVKEVNASNGRYNACQELKARITNLKKRV